MKTVFNHLCAKKEIENNISISGVDACVAGKVMLGMPGVTGLETHLYSQFLANMYPGKKYLGHNDHVGDLD